MFEDEEEDEDDDEDELDECEDDDDDNEDELDDDEEDEDEEEEECDKDEESVEDDEEEEDEDEDEDDILKISIEIPQPTLPCNLQPEAVANWGGLLSSKMDHDSCNRKQFCNDFCWLQGNLQLQPCINLWIDLGPLIKMYTFLASQQEAIRSAVCP